MRHLFSLLLLSCLIPVPASAQDNVSVAREAFNAGALAFREERWMDCAHNFEQSFESIFSPELLYNVALCYERAAGILDDAEALPLLERSIAAYSRYLRETPNATDGVQVQARLYELTLLRDSARRSVEADAAESASDPEEEAFTSGDPEVEEAQAEAPVPVEEPVLVPVPGRGFAFTLTTVGSALTVASFVAALALGAAAHAEFDTLAGGCGQLATGCSESDVDGLSTLVLAANAMYVVSGVLLAGTGLAFGLEFSAWSSGPETRASVQTSFHF